MVRRHLPPRQLPPWQFPMDNFNLEISPWTISSHTNPSKDNFPSENSCLTSTKSYTFSQRNFQGELSKEEFSRLGIVCVRIVQGEIIWSGGERMKEKNRVSCSFSSFIHAWSARRRQHVLSSSTRMLARFQFLTCLIWGLILCDLRAI